MTDIGFLSGFFIKSALNYRLADLIVVFWIKVDKVDAAKEVDDNKYQSASRDGGPGYGDHELHLPRLVREFVNPAAGVITWDFFIIQGSMPDKNNENVSICSKY